MAAAERVQDEDGQRGEHDGRPNACEDQAHDVGAVAQLAGVSIATVSKVVDGRSDVSSTPAPGCGSCCGATVTSLPWSVASRCSSGGDLKAFVALIAVTSVYLTGAGLPLVVLDPLHQPRSEVNGVGSTNFAGGLTALPARMPGPLPCRRRRGNGRQSACPDGQSSFFPPLPPFP